MTPPFSAERKFVCAGETLAMFVPKLGPLADVFSNDYVLTAAGAESNVATYLSRLGNSVGWVSRVGSDHAGSFILSYLESEGVDTCDVEVDSEAPTAVAVKEPSRDGSTVRYYRRGSAASKLCPQHVDTILGLSAAFVHLTGITAALSDTAMEFTEKALAVLPARALVSFDVNLRPALWEKAPAESLLRFASLSETALVGLDEAGALWGCDTPNKVRDLIHQPATLVVKQGPIGSTVFIGKDGTFVPSLEVEVVEPIGAGDAFAAGFLHSHRRGKSPRNSARFGTVLACASLSSHKDIGDMPSEDYIRTLLKMSAETWRTARYSSEMGRPA